ncbi:MAG TPA: cell division protein ZapA [Thermohalobaculum sp.]|nr:cell division protein ZapA [Thermohalobaculum sp.]
MAEVTVEIAGRPYRLGCDEGEEAHLESLAALLDAVATALSNQFSQISEGRLLLMTALVIADKLHDANARIDAKERLLSETKQLADSRANPPDMFGPEQQERLASRINMLAAQLEGAANGAGA